MRKIESMPCMQLSAVLSYFFLISAADKRQPANFIKMSPSELFQFWGVPKKLHHEATFLSYLLQ